MADETGLQDYLAEIAESGRRHAAPMAAERIRARGEQRRRRKRAAAASGGVLLAAALAVGGFSLASAPWQPEPTAADPAPSTSAFVPPSPAPGQEYASELGYVYDAEARGETVRVTVEQLRTVEGSTEPTGVVHTLTLPGRTTVEARELTGGEPTDVELDQLVEKLAGEPRWILSIDYDSEGRVQSLREAHWLPR
ncbi:MULTISPECIES: hypothetical protein [unclassified Streptomyces]|uniref:hypothetical protein n=1 Tax=unclassified Streptomyces TaxID=2593676 RepID=UPI0022B61C3E|nr:MULTISPECIES: hypothetical protein [unclassified Streptomyces]MCZ7414373.1 hypothetical protein [Streptomyces sp. WMMC897]MCZ7431328.1 hypothetical protein [Streptomyces sp. WMMC1477]